MALRPIKRKCFAPFSAQYETAVEKIKGWIEVLSNRHFLRLAI